jgi:hypothetical protein
MVSVFKAPNHEVFLYESCVLMRQTRSIASSFCMYDRISSFPCQFMTINLFLADTVGQGFPSRGLPGYITRPAAAFVNCMYTYTVYKLRNNLGP